MSDSIRYEKERLNRFFIYLLDVILRKRLNCVQVTIDQHNDLIDKRGYDTYLA